MYYRTGVWIGCYDGDSSRTTSLKFLGVDRVNRWVVHQVPIGISIRERCNALHSEVHA
jgi:hypothetical protein